MVISADKKRLDYIDIAKGIGIILVILGHRNVSQNIKQFIYAFHMPLFFMLSGYLFKYKNQGFGRFIKAKAKSLLVPFLFFTFLAGMLQILINLVFSQNGTVSSLEILLDMFYLRGKVSPNVFLWFLMVLFIVEVFSYLFLKAINSAEGYCSIGIAILVCGVIGYNFSGITLPFGIGISFTAIVFFGLGYCVSKINLRNCKTIYLFLSCLLFLALTVLFGMVLNDIVIDMASARYGNYLMFLVAGGAGSIMILLLSVILERFTIMYHGILKFWGKNSIVILVTQYFFFLAFIAFDHLILKTGTSYVSNIRAIVDTVIIMMGETFVIFIINRYFPFIIGKKYDNNLKKSVNG